MCVFQTLSGSLAADWLSVAMEMNAGEREEVELE